MNLFSEKRILFLADGFFDASIVNDEEEYKLFNPGINYLTSLQLLLNSCLRNSSWCAL